MASAAAFTGTVVSTLAEAPGPPCTIPAHQHLLLPATVPDSNVRLLLSSPLTHAPPSFTTGAMYASLLAASVLLYQYTLEKAFLENLLI